MVQIGLYVAACDIKISTFDSSECLYKHTHAMTHKFGRT